MKSIIPLLFLFLLPVVSADLNDFTFTHVYAQPENVTVVMVTTTDKIYYLFDEENLNEIPRFEPYFFDNFVLTNNNQVCTGQFVKAVPKPGAKYEYTIAYACEESIDQLNLSYDLFFEVSDVHKNVVNFHMGGKRIQRTIDDNTRSVEYDAKSRLIKYGLIIEEVVTNEQGEEIVQPVIVDDPVSEERSGIMSEFIWIGIIHIILGYDHVLFVLGLILVTLRIRQVLAVITSFTVAHSITLILTTLGITNLNIQFVESVIALSITYIAIENYFILKKTKSWFGNPDHRWKLSFGFGLIHGFGFASVLSDVGLPADGFVLSLLSFNIGVELGQLAIVALVLPLIWYISKKPWSHYFTLTGSGIIGLLGLVWFVERALGL